jgi:metallo-beta-lactamase family protein
MTFELQFLGATRQVTGSNYLLRTPDSRVLLECGLIQGSRADEAHNRDGFPYAIEDLDAVVLSHAHIDHSGRVPLLVKRGYAGPVYAQKATRALCSIMLPDSGYLNEKDAEWENSRLRNSSEARVEPLYTRDDAERSLGQFEGLDYGEPLQITPDLTLRYHDAGHILGSAIVEITWRDRTLVFSGDLGYRDAPVMNPPTRLTRADAVLMESTYGDRLHRPFDETMAELADVFETARAAQGNILIPAFTVGRTQDLLYLFAENYERWNLDDWHIFLDSPMGIDATAVYSRYRELFGAKLFGPESSLPDLPNFHATRTSRESMTINQIRSGAIIIAGSGMCTGGRILHHLKNNVWRPECHIVIVGFQAHGTLGRRLVDGADEIRLWGDSYAVRANVHTVGGLSAHADQADLVDWYSAFENRPPLYLVHGEEKAQVPLREKIESVSGARVTIADYAQTVRI